MGQGTQSIDRASELLSLVVRAETPLTFTELVEKTGLTRSTTSRLLLALERNGLLERGPEGLLRGGELFAHYAARFDRVESLLALAEPAMERIAEETGETVYLGVPRGDAVVQVAQIDSRFLIGTTNWVDVDVPPHCSALGKVMYAYGAIALPQGLLEQRTEVTIADVGALEDELEAIRGAGFALTRGELEEGLDAIAAPVFTAGAVVAAVGVSGPEFRLADNHERIGRLLVAETAKLSKVVERRPRPPTR